ncbi:MAG: aminotransferase class I/II-fold pyridoxal phosphate-dependent enzyme [Nitrospira sp.]|nr:aminotransferase class I/II-fold pyridoxal phosphate-dependent enzyme [Nitrospira sp.]
MKTPLAARLDKIQPFHVMAVLARAHELERQGRSIIHMEIGEPDFPTASGIVRAAVRAIEAGHTHYLPALGLPELRERIAGSYPPGARPAAGRVVVTPGASGALQLIFAALLNPGDQVLMTDPGYPCNRHFVSLFEGEARAILVDARTEYQLDAALVRKHWTARTVAVLLSSPSNPTGTLVSEEHMAEIVAAVRELGGRLIVDEIYGGLTYGVEAKTVLAHSQDVFVVNSFSKYYGMTGWRVGWLVTPEVYSSAIDKLAQNIFIATGTPSQYGALAAFKPQVEKELRRRVQIFRERRDYLLPALRDLGFDIPVTPQGAFYFYADCTRFTTDSQQFALDLLERSGVAVTPGLDFGVNQPECYIRFSYATTLANLQEGVRRLRAYLA